MLQQLLNDQIVNVCHVQSVVDDCSDLLDQLESALDSAEKVCPEEELQDYAARLAGSRRK